MKTPDQALRLPILRTFAVLRIKTLCSESTDLRRSVGDMVLHLLEPHLVLWRYTVAHHLSYTQLELQLTAVA